MRLCKTDEMAMEVREDPGTPKEHPWAVSIVDAHTHHCQ